MVLKFGGFSKFIFYRKSGRMQKPIFTHFFSDCEGYSYTERDDELELRAALLLGDGGDGQLLHAL